METLKELAPAPIAENSAAAARPCADLRIGLHDGLAHRTLEAASGETLLIVLKRAGLPVLAVCGGKGACGTCRVAIDPAWADALPPAEKRELRLLTHLKAARFDRLSCRITLSAALNGLQVRACESVNQPVTLTMS